MQPLYLHMQGIGKLTLNTDVKWNVIKKCAIYQPGNCNCNLCLTEKLCIIKSGNNPNNINKRNDAGSIYLHTRKFL